MKQPSNEQKKDIVKKIRLSQTFKKASTSNALLQYLLDATLNEVQLKESIIDIEFFRNTIGSKKDTPQVRVNVYNLRKKLTAYYETEGKNDKWQARIDKGQYGVQFVSNKDQNILDKVNWKHASAYAILVTTLLILSINTLPESTPKLWKSILSKNAESKLYIGDLFGMVGTTTIGNKGWTRDYDINSFPDFYTYIELNPQYKEQLAPSPFTLTNGMAVTSAQQFQSFFQARNSSFQIRFSTRATIKEIKESNAIYVGTIVNDNPFLTFFNEANNHCQLQGRELHINQHPSIADTTYDLAEPAELEEYAIVSKYPVADGVDHFVFFSQHDIGVAATVEYFTNTDSVKHFEKTHLDGKDYFTAIYKVKGQDRTNIGIQMEAVIGF